MDGVCRRRRRRRCSQWRSQPLGWRRHAWRRLFFNRRLAGRLRGPGGLRRLLFLGGLRRGARFFGHRSRGAIGIGSVSRFPPTSSENLPQFHGDILIDRAGVCLFFRNAQLGEFVQQFVSFDFQLPSQHVNPNLVHKSDDFVSDQPCFS